MPPPRVKSVNSPFNKCAMIWGIIFGNIFGWLCHKTFKENIYFIYILSASLIYLLYEVPEISLSRTMLVEEKDKEEEQKGNCDKVLLLLLF